MAEVSMLLIHNNSRSGVTLRGCDSYVCSCGAGETRNVYAESVGKVTGSFALEGQTNWNANIKAD
jgi:hypothetical protein